MEGPLKELAKLDKLTSKSPAKGKLPSIDILDSLLQSLRDAKASVEDGTASEDTLVQLAHTVKLRKEEIDKKQKEVYNSLTRYGKALDKVSLLVHISGPLLRIGGEQFRHSPPAFPRILRFLHRPSLLRLLSGPLLSISFEQDSSPQPKHSSRFELYVSMHLQLIDLSSLL